MSDLWPQPLQSLPAFLHPFSLSAEKQKSLNVSGVILPPRVIVGQKGRVTVSIEGRRVDRVQTAWFLNDTPISDTSLTGIGKMVLLTFVTTDQKQKNKRNWTVVFSALHETAGKVHKAASPVEQLLLCFVRSKKTV